MAKFKVGDKVIGSRSGLYGTNDDYGIVVKLIPDGNYVTVKSGKYGRDIDYHESDLRLANSCASTNPVVQNALVTTGVARNADGDPESLVNWKRIYPKLKEFNSIAGWLKGEGVKLMNVARNFDDKKFHSVGNDVQSVCEWAERKSAEILNRV